ncbi:MAG: hypothetical protein H8E94_06645, partial [Alphaproteobacteria bacterium]|nr:hypothetical protein [Alphaproteobacteria bacterium]
MGNIRSVFLVFGFLSIVFFAPFEASAQQSCGDMATCAQGQNGPGGCYRPHRQDCYDGLICSKSMRLCSPGPNGPGGCYKLNYAQCFSGLICEPGMEPCNDAQGPRCVRIGSNLCNRPAQACPTGMHPCKPGPYGPGGCYKLNYAQCFDGLICEPGMQPCNDAQGPRCVRVVYTLCNRPAAVCPQGMRECPSGPNGPGGCYKLNYAQCLGGLICEPGMQVCNDALGPRCVR